VSDKTGIDTTPFRRAVWFYTHRLFGLQHDDFDYNKIPVFLTAALKTFIRKIACAPETITKEDFALKGQRHWRMRTCRRRRR
jgi:sestrin